MSLRHPGRREVVEANAADLSELVRRAHVEWGIEESRSDAILRDLSSGFRRMYADPEADGDGSPRLTVRTLAELLLDPDLLKAPEAVVPRLGWSGRTTLLAADPKGGKSTKGAAAAAGCSRGGTFLGEPCRLGDVLWLLLEEHPGDLARKLVSFNADPERVHIMDRPTYPLQDLTAAVHRLEPAFVVVDTLPALVEALSPDPGSSTAWQPIMTAIARVARETDAAVLLLHHLGKNTRRYRDSSAIGAGVDVILEMHPSADDPALRRVEVQARWKLDPWEYRLDGDPMGTGDPPVLTLVTGGLSVREQVVRHLARSPGCSQRSLEGAVTARAKVIRDEVDALFRAGDVVDRGGKMGRALYLRADDPENPHGHATDAPRTHPGRTTPAKVRPEGDTPPLGGVPPDAPPSDAVEVPGLLEVGE